MNAKSIFITGAANGIGRQTALHFVSKGWYAGLFDLDAESLNDLVHEIGDQNAVAYEGDVTNLVDLDKAFKDFAQKTEGNLHVLFNNAGILQAGEFDKISLEDHHRLIDVNIKGVLNTTHLALPMLIETSGSHILSMCSASSFFGNPELTAYAASKSAVKSMTEGWSCAFAKYDIKVSDLQPIYVATDMVKNNMDVLKGLSEKDVRLSPEKIAHFAWKAVHSNRLHWPIGIDTRVFRFLMRFFPDSVNKWVLKKVIKYD